MIGIPQEDVGPLTTDDGMTDLQFDTIQPSEQGCVYLIGDDLDVRNELGSLLRLLGYAVRIFSDPVLFIERIPVYQPSVVILDTVMPQMSGLEVQRRLASIKGLSATVIFLSGDSDRKQIVQGIKAGAHDFLGKPIFREEIADAVDKAMALSIVRTARLTTLRGWLNSISQLSARERHVFDFMLSGYQNKQIAIKLDIRSDTVKKHRTVICEKFQVSGTPDLIILSRLAATEFGLANADLVK
jgi:FixJ family two-component response regulator